MQYRKFGHTGLTVSRLCLGTMTFGLQTEEDVSRGILDKATDAGVNFIDTADVYPLGGGENLAGRTEEIIGRWLKGKRDRFILATKAVGKVRFDLLGRPLSLRRNLRQLRRDCFQAAFSCAEVTTGNI